MTTPRKTSERTRASLELLYAISRELTAQLDLRELLQRILQLTLENIGAHSGSILVLDEQGNVIEGALAYGGKVHDHTAEQLADTFERGLAGWVFENRQPALIRSTRDDPRWLQRPDGGDDGGSRSAISVPLTARDRVVGVLTIVHPQPGRFNEEDLALLSAIADQAGIAVENARLFAAEQQRRQLASTLQEIARIINASLEPERVFQQVLEQLARLIPYDSASIFLVEKDHMRLMAARGFEDNEALIGLTLPLDSGVFGVEVIHRREATVVEDVQREPGWVKSGPFRQVGKIRGWIGAPLVVRDQVVGVLNVDSHRPGAYGPAELEVVRAFADHAAVAVANAQLFAASQRQLRATQALAEAARAVTASLDLDEVLERILDQTMRSLEVEAASLALVEAETGELRFHIARGRAAEAVRGLRLRPGEGIAGWVLEHGDPVIVPDVHADPRFYADADAHTGFETRAVACVPIQVQDRVIGVLEAINPPDGEFLPEHVELLTGIAGLAGTAISHARLFAETQAARRRYAGLFEDSIDPILITDLQGTITEANHSAEAFLGYQRGELLGRGILSLHVPDPERLPEDLSQLKQGETLAYNGRATHREGHPLPVEVHVKRIDIGGQPHLQWILRDISERLELDELRADLIQMIFHDLRSPLGNVISSLEVLKASLPEEDETVQSVLTIALRSSRRLSRLVESLLDLNQLEAGQAVLHKSKASIGAVLTDAVEEVHPVAEAKGHTIRFNLATDLPLLEFDVEMIRRVLINLLENAIKYTPSGGSIDVSARREADKVVVSVRDTGPGIPAHEQSRVFEKFSRIQAEGCPKGLGLGLAFCRLAVEAHGGRIWVESQEGQGSTFSFTLPL